MMFSWLAIWRIIWQYDHCGHYEISRFSSCSIFLVGSCVLDTKSAVSCATLARKFFTHLFFFWLVFFGGRAVEAVWKFLAKLRRGHKKQSLVWKVPFSALGQKTGIFVPGHIYGVRKTTFSAPPTRLEKGVFPLTGKKNLLRTMGPPFFTRGGGSPPRASQKKTARAPLLGFFLTGPRGWSRRKTTTKVRSEFFFP